MSEEQEVSLFLGGRYYSSYFDLTCALSHFCCSTENQASTPEPWEVIAASFPNRYENCWATSLDTVHWKDVTVRNCNDALKNLEKILVQFHSYWFSTPSLNPLLVEYNCGSAQFCIPGPIPSNVLPVDEFNSTTLTNKCQASLSESTTPTSNLTETEQTIIFTILGAIFFLSLLFVLRVSI
ncbi:unnamed protein product [Oikopleura dioica]|uniref:Uncharacterized protein n=1 Tax=Oikopleura dioica TaxID=34765 RepID=E4Z6I1_OIKDI|nr:unnamed protein product [Oikopleura dioica]